MSEDKRLAHRIAVVVKSVRIEQTSAEHDLQIDPGDWVTIRMPNGRQRTGRATLVSDAHAVLDMGGAHGTPGIATAENILRVKKN